MIESIFILPFIPTKPWKMRIRCYRWVRAVAFFLLKVRMCTIRKPRDPAIRGIVAHAYANETWKETYRLDFDWDLKMRLQKWFENETSFETWNEYSCKRHDYNFESFQRFRFPISYFFIIFNKFLVNSTRKNACLPWYLQRK